MGADVFETMALGKTARDAFSDARDEEAWEHGHGGYTGTIAEKGSFELVVLPPRVTAQKMLRWIELAEDCAYAQFNKEEMARAEAALKVAKPGTIRKYQAWVRKAKAAVKADEKALAKYKKTVGTHEALVEECRRIHTDKWGPALAFEITGKAATDYKRRSNIAARGDKVFLFCGWASC